MMPAYCNTTTKCCRKRNWHIWGMSAGELSFWLSDAVPLPGTTVG